jgi:Mg-chelatase subunit ChlD
MAYGVRVKLNAAVDAAAIAAGKVISQGSGAASTQATNSFNTNFPSGTLGSTVTSGPNTDAVHNPNGSWDITVTASATVPTTFARVVGWRNFTVSAIAATYIRTLDLVLVLDSSGSLNTPNTTPALLRSAAKNFIQNFDSSSDRIGLIHFASGAVQDVTMTDTRGFSLTTLNNAIDNISVHGATTSEEALRMARAQLDGVTPASQSSLRAIVFFTDGAPNGVAGTFTNNGSPVQGDLYSETDLTYDPCGTSGNTAIRMFQTNQQDNFLNFYCNIPTLPDTDYTGTVNLASYNNIRTFNPTGNPVPNTRCNVNRAARNMLENIANAARSEAGNPIHVFTIGLGASLTTQEIGFCGYGSNESGDNILRRLANVSGVDTYNSTQPAGLYAFAADASQLNNAFNQVASAILRLTK